MCQVYCGTALHGRRHEAASADAGVAGGETSERDQQGTARPEPSEPAPGMTVGEGEGA